MESIINSIEEKNNISKLFENIITMINDEEILLDEIRKYIGKKTNYTYKYEDIYYYEYPIPNNNKLHAYHKSGSISKILSKITMTIDDSIYIKNIDNYINEKIEKLDYELEEIAEIKNILSNQKVRKMIFINNILSDSIVRYGQILLKYTDVIDNEIKNNLCSNNVEIKLTLLENKMMKIYTNMVQCKIKLGIDEIESLIKKEKTLKRFI